MKPKIRLAIVTTHPIQYNAPLFKLMNDESNKFTIKVFYTWSQSQEQVYDKDFQISIKWGIPLLEGYEFTFVKNVSANPGSHHFNGVVNPTLINEIENWGADAVLVLGWSFSSHLKAMRFFYRRIPVLFRGDSTLIDEPAAFSVKKMVRRIFLKWVYKHVDLGLYVGSENRKYFETHGLVSDKLIFAPHAVDNNRFSNNSEELDARAQNWKGELGIPKSAVVILFAAKLTKKKDPETLVRSFLEANDSHLWLIIVGNGELEKELKLKYAKHGKITFIDFQNQAVMPIVYRLGDFFVLPSKGPGETWGLAINEAMASGRAVIASDKCGCSNDLIFNGKNGYVFKSGSSESLKKCIELAAKDFKKLGNTSREIIQEWNYSKTIDQLNAFIKKTTPG